MSAEKLGPNVKRLLIKRMATITTTGRDFGGVCQRIAEGGLSADARQAKTWVEAALRAVRLAGEPNPWKEATDEEIAGEILRRMAERRNSGKQ